MARSVNTMCFSVVGLPISMLTNIPGSKAPSLLLSKARARIVPDATSILLSKLWIVPW